MSSLAWDLSSLYGSMGDPEIIADLKKLEVLVCDLEKSISQWFAQKECRVVFVENFFRQLEAITKISSKVGHFIRLSYSSDMTVEHFDSLRGALNLQKAAIVKINTRFEAYLAKVPNLDKLISSSAYLNDFTYRIKELVGRQVFNFSEKIEVMIKQLLQNGLESWANMQLRRITNNTIEYDGKALSMHQFRTLEETTDRKCKLERNTAYNKSFIKHEEFSLEALNNIKGDVIAVNTARGYSSVLDEALQVCRMKEKTLNALLKACNDNMEPLREYYRLKAQRTGYDVLPYYEISSPIRSLGKIPKKYNISAAEDMILQSFKGFSSGLAECAGTAFRNRWIDYLPRKNKSGAAFCSGIYPLSEFRVLLNYDYTLNAVRTLAHELGHGYHGLKLSEEIVFRSEVTAVTAETGSTFCEAVFGDYLEKNTQEEDLLSYYDFMLGGQVGTIVDCLSAFYFEKELFTKRGKGPLTVQEMQEATLMGFKKTYGNAVDIDSYNKNMWISRLHFYNPSVNYYNFPYTFGLLFSLALYSKFKEAGAGFIPKYDKFLKMTGSASVEQLGELVEIDVNDSKEWEKSIIIILDKIDNYKKLI